jgi:voltage-gated sodium channel
MSNPIAPASQTGGVRQRLRDFITARGVQNIILALIIINAISLGLETSPRVMGSIGGFILLLDTAILSIFVAEVAIRLFVHRGAFFKDAWSVFDLVVVGIALVPSAGPFAVLRALRVLRVLRVLTIVPSMRRVVGALLGAIPGLVSIAMVLVLVYYVAAVVTTNLFAESFPEWFGSIGASLYTLFQVMTLESWSMGIARPVMEKFPYAWAFFVPFILIATFTMLNLFIAVIVNAMQTVSEEEAQDEALAHPPEKPPVDLDQMAAEMKALRSEIQALHSLLRSRAG